MMLGISLSSYFMQFVGQIHFKASSATSKLAIVFLLGKCKVNRQKQIAHRYYYVSGDRGCTCIS